MGSGESASRGESAASTTVCISDATRAKLRELAAQSGLPIGVVVERAVEEYRRQRFFQAVDAAFAALRVDPAAWQVEVEERRQLEGALADGLDDGELAGAWI